MKYTHGALVIGSQKVKDRVMEEVEKEAYGGAQFTKDYMLSYRHNGEKERYNMTEKDLSEVYRMLLHKAKSMGCNEIKALYNIPLKNMEMIVQALDKQIPKQPIYEGDGYSNRHLVYDTWICPCCETRYEVDYDDYDYCPNCGQKLDWSDKE